MVKAVAFTVSFGQEPDTPFSITFFIVSVTDNYAAYVRQYRGRAWRGSHFRWPDAIGIVHWSLEVT